MIFVMKFQAAAMSRANIDEDDRVDFCLYVDEFQNFSTDSFATIMSEARKYRLNLVVANQFTTQLTEEIRDAVFGNIGTTVAFRIGQNDVDVLSRYFQPLFDADDLLRIPNRNTIVRTLIGGVPTQAFSMATIAPLGSPNKELGDALKQLSAAKYGRPRQVVDKEIMARMDVGDIDAGNEPKPNAPPNPYATSQTPQGAMTSGQQDNFPAQPAPSGAGSFLDQWLDKKKKDLPTGSATQPKVNSQESDEKSNGQAKQQTESLNPVEAHDENNKYNPVQSTSPAQTKEEPSNPNEGTINLRP